MAGAIAFLTTCTTHPGSCNELGTRNEEIRKEISGLRAKATSLRILVRKTVDLDALGSA